MDIYLQSQWFECILYRNIEVFEGMRNINVKILKNIYFSEEFKKHPYPMY